MRHAYYNEYDKPTAAWLRDLIGEGLIADGVVDDRPIERVTPGELTEFTQCHFFAGIGGWSRALRLAGWPDDRPVWTGSCPCQPFSSAGRRRGFDDERHIWPQFFRLIAERRPATVFGEQVDDAASQHDWLDRVHTDLEGRGYAVGAIVFPAAAVGSPHGRDRLYFVADSDRRRLSPELSGIRPRTDRDSMESGFWKARERVRCPDGKRRATKPGVRTVAHGVPNYMALIRGAGNAIVPQQAAQFIRAFVETSRVSDLQ
jgi:DNA (cytosine-5)-methyltransferase 1